MFKIMICESTFKILKKFMTQKNVALYYNVNMYITIVPLKSHLKIISSLLKSPFYNEKY
jgi:hypothetical protein